MRREMSVNGHFYPDSKNDIEKYISSYNKILDETLSDANVLKHRASAIIVPHAGYIYSGFTANIAYRIMSYNNPKRAIVIGPSHKNAHNGVSIGLHEAIETPLGDLKIDSEYIKQLVEQFNMKFEPNLHHEHSTEVQMPFIKAYLPEISVIEMVYSKCEPTKLAEIISLLLEDSDNMVIISTDLSHFYHKNEAEQYDNICLTAINEVNPSILHKGCQACGKIGVEALLLAAQEKKMHSQILDHRTSADTSNDESSVVGYTSAYLY